MPREHAHSGATCEPHRDLLVAAARCERALAAFPDDDPDHRRARAILTATARHCRTAAQVFDLDPTLADELHDTGRLRAIDLLAELARQLRPALRFACSKTDLDRWPRQTRWDEAEALVARGTDLAETIVQVLPRPDHATEAGSQAISHDRLAAHADGLSDAAATIRAAIADALRLPHPDPQALALARLADQLARQADDLAAHHAEQAGALATACGLAE